jgi:hypothetical protein
MFSSLILAGIFCASIHVSVQLDTVPKARVEAVVTEEEWEANEVERAFHDHYISGNYPLFKGSITRIAPGVYRLDSFTMRVDSLPKGMMGLLSRRLLYPDLLIPVFGSTDTLWVGNFHELKSLSSSPQVRRFSCWISNSRMHNPILYVFELTNQQGAANMKMATFLRYARLTFLYQVSLIL